MRYRYDAEVYVWPRVTELGKELLEAQPEHRFVMQKLVQGGAAPRYRCSPSRVLLGLFERESAILPFHFGTMRKATANNGACKYGVPTSEGYE